MDDIARLLYNTGKKALLALKTHPQKDTPEFIDIRSNLYMATCLYEDELRLQGMNKQFESIEAAIFGPKHRNLEKLEQLGSCEIEDDIA